MKINGVIADKLTLEDLCEIFRVDPSDLAPFDRVAFEAFLRVANAERTRTFHRRPPVSRTHLLLKRRRACGEC
jgi:hypothetical protein